MNVAIIVAAGSGKRFGAETPKQFLDLNGKPLIIHTLEKFCDCEMVEEIILVVAAEETERTKSLLEKFALKKISRIVEGGATRAKSVAAGFSAIDKSRANIVAVHDGARPLVTAAEISKTIVMAQETGAACLVARVEETIKEISEGKIVRTIDRRKLRRALTPQAFRYAILERALGASELGEDVTDESFLVEKLGEPVSIVEGNSRNFKITNREDLEFAKRLMAEF